MIRVLGGLGYRDGMPQRVYTNEEHSPAHKEVHRSRAGPVVEFGV